MDAPWILLTLCFTVFYLCQASRWLVVELKLKMININGRLTSANISSLDRIYYAFILKSFLRHDFSLQILSRR